MSLRRISVHASAVALLCTAVSGSALAEPPLDHYAGSTRTTTVDPVELTFDGENRFDGTGPLGAFALEGLDSWIYDFSLPCDPGDLPIRLVTGGAVVTFERHRDQLMLLASEGRICLDVSTLKFVGIQTGTISGGSGRFEGASGTFETSFEGEDVLPDLSRVSGTLAIDLD